LLADTLSKMYHVKGKMNKEWRGKKGKATEEKGVINIL
jgi:hypothetical protein